MARILTNDFNLPETLKEAMTVDTHPVAGDISCSELIDAPQIRILKKKHTIVEDVSEKIFMLLGTAVHNILERANIKNVRRRAFLTVIQTLKEHYDELKASNPDETTQQKMESMQKVTTYLFKYMEAIFPEIAGRYLFELTLRFDVDGMITYGTLDIYDLIDKILWDYKVTSVYSYIYPESRKKWVRQLNIYAFFLRRHGYEVKEGKIVAIFRDFSRKQAGINKDYPPRQITEIPVEIFDEEKQYEYLYKRVMLHREAEKGQIPECTGDEMWASSDEFVVKTETAKKKALPTSRCNTKAAALQWMKDNDHKYKGMYIEERIGERRRCEGGYCPVSEVCPQYKNYLEKKGLSHVIPD